MRNLLEKSKLLLLSLFLLVQSLWAVPIEISTWAELQAINEALSGEYILVNNLSSATTGYDTYASSSANAGAGWNPIGAYPAPTFSGTFDGDNYSISNLYISRSGTDYIGLFGYSESCTISNVKVLSATVTGKVRTAILIGAQIATLSNIQVSGTVSGTQDVGGVMGIAQGSITKSTSSANASGTSNTGSFVGNAWSDITDCYSTGTTTRASGTNANFGNFAGTYSAGSIYRCYATGTVLYDGADPTDKGFCGSAVTTGASNYWDTQVSGQATGNGATGKTTAQMKDIDNYPAVPLATGTVNVAYDEGMWMDWVVTRVSGTSFDAGWSGNITIDGSSYVISMVIDGDTMITSCQTTKTGVAYSYGSIPAWDMALKANHDGQEATAVWYIDDGVDYPRLWFEYVPLSVLTVVIAGSGTVKCDTLLYTEPLEFSPPWEVTFEAFPEDGWVFSGWSGAFTSEENPHDETLSVDGSYEVTATFTQVGGKKIRVSWFN